MMLSTKSRKSFALTSSIIPGLVALGFSSCSPETATVDTKGKKVENQEANATETTEEDVIDFEKTCGLKTKTEEGEDPDKVLFAVKMKSLPIVSQGSQMGVSFRVTLAATLDVESKAKSGGGMNLDVKVGKVEVAAGSPLLKVIGMAVAKGKAESAAKDASQSQTGESVPLGQWLNLVTEGGQFKDLLCAISPPSIKGRSKSASGSEGVYEYTPGLPQAVSPLAPRETLEKEIGSGREFKVTTKVVSQKKGGLPVGEYPTNVSIKPREPTIKMSDGTTYASDIAYEVNIKAESPAGFKGVNEINGIRSYFINLKEHTFEAVMDSTQVETQGIKTPIIVLLRDK